MTKTNHTAPAVGGQYRVELTRTSRSPQWWEYTVIDSRTGALMAGGEIRGARHLAQLAGDREARRLEASRQPFYIPPVENGYRIPC
jgi:hypothetical protein